MLRERRARPSARKSPLGTRPEVWPEVVIQPGFPLSERTSAADIELFIPLLHTGRVAVDVDNFWADSRGGRGSRMAELRAGRMAIETSLFATSGIAALRHWGDTCIEGGQRTGLFCGNTCEAIVPTPGDPSIFGCQHEHWAFGRRRKF